MISLKQRLQDELIAGGHTTLPSYDDATIIARNELRDQQRLNLPKVTSHIAADVEGLIPKEQLAAITTEYMELQRSYDEDRLGWKTDDGSAEQDLLVRRGKLDQKLVNVWQAALARYMKGDS